LAKGIVASVSPIDGLVSKTFRFKAERFLRWEKNSPNPRLNSSNTGGRNNKT